MREAGWDRNADHAHLGEVGPLAAQQLLHLGAAFGRAAAKGINVLLQCSPSFSVAPGSRVGQVHAVAKWEALCECAWQITATPIARNTME